MKLGGCLWRLLRVFLCFVARGSAAGDIPGAMQGRLSNSVGVIWPCYCAASIGIRCCTVMLFFGRVDMYFWNHERGACWPCGVV